MVDHGVTALVGGRIVDGCGVARHRALRAGLDPADVKDIKPSALRTIDSCSTTTRPRRLRLQAVAAVIEILVRRTAAIP